MIKKVCISFFIFLVISIFSYSESIGQHVKFTKKSLQSPVKKKAAQVKNKTDKKIETAFEILRLVLTFCMWILIVSFILLIVMMGIKYILVLRKVND